MHQWLLKKKKIIDLQFSVPVFISDFWRRKSWQSQIHLQGMCWVLLVCSHGLFSTFAHCPMPEGLASVQTCVDGFTVLLTPRFWVVCSPWEGPSEILEGGRVRSEYQFPWFFLEGWLLPSTKGPETLSVGLALELPYLTSNFSSFCPFSLKPPLS